MKSGPDIAALASLIGDPARANILAALMGGKALTAGECAAEAGISAPTASGHLAKLLDADLLVVLVQGRHRYFNLAGPDVAEAIETLMGLAARVGLKRTRPGPREATMRNARFCYDHLAGDVATALFARLVDRGLLVAKPEGVGLSPLGRSRFLAEGVDIAAHGDHRSVGIAPADAGHQPRAGNALHTDRIGQTERPLEHGTRAGLLKREFRVRVQITAQVEQSVALRLGEQGQHAGRDGGEVGDVAGHKGVREWDAPGPRSS